MCAKIPNGFGGGEGNPEDAQTLEQMNAPQAICEHPQTELPSKKRDLTHFSKLTPKVIKDGITGGL